MAHSPFYRQRFGDRFPVPALAFERLMIALSKAEEVSDGIFIEVLKSCCGIKRPKPDDVLYLAKRLEEAAVAASDSGEEVITGPQQLAFGTQDNDWLKKKSLSELLLLACGFDFTKAEYLYCSVDREMAIEVLRLFLEQRRENSRLQLEACLYGFGGGYAKENAHDPENGVFDLTNHTDGDTLLKELF